MMLSGIVLGQQCPSPPPPTANTDSEFRAQCQRYGHVVGSGYSMHCEINRYWCYPGGVAPRPEANDSPVPDVEEQRKEAERRREQQRLADEAAKKRKQEEFEREHEE